MSRPTSSDSYQDTPLSYSQPMSGSHGITSQPWTSNRPSQPPIVIPAIVKYEQAKPVSNRLSIFNGEVLQKWTRGNCTLPDKSYPVWDYHDRRTSQQVLPFLFLGPWGAVKDRNFLRERQITMLLGARDTQYIQSRIMDGTKIANEVGIGYVSVDVSGPGDLIAAIPKAIEQINTHLQEFYERSQADSPQTTSFGKVLVFCESGNERSATIAAAYLMTMFNINIGGRHTYRARSSILRQFHRSDERTSAIFRRNLTSTTRCCNSHGYYASTSQGSPEERLGH